MKTNKTFAYGILSVLIALVIALAFTACDNENGNSTPDTREPIIASYSATPASITVPAENTVQLTCTATSKDGSAVKSVKWTVEEKPELANPTIVNAETAAATVNNMEVAGTYKFKLIVTGNNDATKTEYVTVIAGLYYEVEFVSLGTAGDVTINFSPKYDLPVGVTYILEDNKGINSWNSTGFNGVVNASGYNDGNVIFTQTFYLNGAEIASSTRTVNMGVDTFPDAYFMAIVSDTGSVTLKWLADMSLPITHAITVPAIALSLPSSTLNFAQTYTGYTADFPSGCVTYKIVNDKGHTWNNGEVVDASDASLGYGNSEWITFTQTFYYNGQPVGSRDVKLRYSTSGGGRFTAIEINGSTELTGTIPELTLLLRKNAGE